MTAQKNEISTALPWRSLNNLKVASSSWEEAFQWVHTMLENFQFQHQSGDTAARKAQYNGIVVVLDTIEDESSHLSIDLVYTFHHMKEDSTQSYGISSKEAAHGDCAVQIGKDFGIFQTLDYTWEP
ncbi:hypothetical protein M422DRAFT_53441 [Sphaerobolus stellatus SS14]|uniref:Uncharacterized protein n=1 Tax=Sphaerobolus stellatus (strain SS14) TaxID=990650 RepID=A0A0C9TMP4_SPHS4|nr:hypothetical protein M422DRAFT_53441 [Sphaerobolus stellatus SS14]